MQIAKKIVIAFVTVSLIPILVISAFSGLTIYGVSNDNANDAAAALREEALDNQLRIANDTSLFIEERMQQYFDGVYMMEEYCENLFNGVMNISPTYSYFWDPTQEALRGHPVPGLSSEYYDRYSSYEISFDVSCYYMPRNYYEVPNDPFARSAELEYFLNTSSNMDNIYRALHEANPDYIWLYMAFNPTFCDNHLMRNYPYDNLIYFQQDEDGNPVQPADDYEPILEEWYTNPASETGNQVVISSTYEDPSTGLVLSMGRPAHFTNGSLIGVVSADVTLQTILASVLNIQVLDSGYAFLLNSDGSVIGHPSLTVEGQTIYDLEFESSSSSEATAFSSILSTALGTGSGQTTYMKGGKEWYITYSRVENSDFLLAVVVPVTEVVAPALEILESVQTQTFFLTAILVGVLAVVAAVVTMASYNRGQAVVKPINEMTRLVKKMSQQDFTRGLTTSGAMYEEIGTTVDALLSFQEAMRFGNQAFIRGDLNRALANYQNLLEISQRLKIRIGEQTMYLNIGNVFRQRGDPGNALEYYNNALTLANEMLEEAKGGGLDETDAMARVASVYHNIALVKMDQQNHDEAMQFLEDAEVIDRSLGNNRGLAKRFDAMGLVQMRKGMYSAAQSKFNEALSTAQAEGYDRSNAYINYHLGELYQAEGKWRKAEAAFNDAIRLARETEEHWLAVYAMQMLADILDQLDKPSHDIRRQAERLRRSIQFKKSVIFVIDYSGSMRAQERIKAAIAGAREILDTQVNPQDRVSIIVFNSGYREVLPLTEKGEYEDPYDSPIIRALNSLRYPNNATAFYDALGKALQELDRIESSEHRWVIAITDGEDNSSEVFSLDYLKKIFTEKDRLKRRRPLTIEGYIRDNHLDVNLIIIGVGRELKNRIEAKVRHPETRQRMTTEQLLSSICDNVPQGQYFSVVDSRNIRLDLEKTFQEVGVMMAQLEVGGSTVDY